MRFSQPSIYLTTYKGKRYVGKTHGTRSTNYHGSGNIIRRIIKKHGKSVLKTKLLEATTLDKLDQREIYWIAKLKPEMNIAPGGEGGDRSMSFTPAIAKSKSKKMSAFPRSKEWCDNIRKSKQGSKHSEESKKKMSKAHTGKTLSKQTKLKIKKAVNNFKDDPQYRKRLSAAITKWWADRRKVGK